MWSIKTILLKKQHMQVTDRVRYSIIICNVAQNIVHVLCVQLPDDSTMQNLSNACVWFCLNIWQIRADAHVLAVQPKDAALLPGDY